MFQRHRLAALCYSLGLLLLAMLVPPIATQAAPPPDSPIEGRVVVLFAPGVSPSRRAAALAQHAPQAQAAQSAVHPRLAVLQVPPGQEQAVAARLRSDRAITAAAQDQRVTAAEVPAEYDASNQPNLAQVDLPDAWAAGATGRGVRIGIIDSGLDTDHSEFPASRIDSPKVLLSPGYCPGTTTDIKDNTGHGTHVTGIAAASGNNGGVAGVAWEATIMPVKVLDACNSGSWADIVQGIYWATDHEADVINLSLGGYLYPADPNSASLIAIIQDAVDFAVSRGVVLTAAAGNDDENLDTDPFYPAASDGVLAVAAVTNADTKAIFSNFGAAIAVSAPGVNIYSTTPTYPIPGVSPSYGVMSGTSMASPHVAGLVALLRQQDRTLGVDDVRAIFAGTAVDLGASGDDPYFGIGRIAAAGAVRATLLTPARYFAEGYTGAGFDEYLTLQNTNDQPSVVRLQFQYAEADSGPAQRYVTLPASTRVTLRVNDITGDDRAVSVVFSAPPGVMAERPMYFRYGAEAITGGHVAAGAPAPSQTWYFAEGYTGPGFAEYITIQNPNASAGTATITYYIEGASTPEVRNVPLAANSRTTVSVHEPQSAGNPGGLGRGFANSFKVTTDVPTVVERPMYFIYNGAITGGHTVVGVTAPRTAWSFAEGYTGAGFDEYLTLHNPNDQASTATITYYLEAGGGPVLREVALAAHSRTTVAVHQEQSAANPGGLGRRTTGHSIDVTSGLPIVVERPMYFVYNRTITGGHDTFGATAPATTWSFAEGYTGDGFYEYLTLQNPNAEAGRATITYYVEGSSTPEEREIALPPRSRTTVAVHTPPSASNPGGLGRLAVGHSTRIQSTVPVVVERPMYFVYKGSIDGGHVALGQQP